MWLQWQRAILFKHLKVPPAFTSAPRPWPAPGYLTARAGSQYRPEKGQEKKQRCWLRLRKKLLAEGLSHQEATCPSSSGQYCHHFGGDKKTQRVVTAHQVDPIELVVFLSALCRKRGIPCCVIQGKAELGI